MSYLLYERGPARQGVASNSLESVFSSPTFDSTTVFGVIRSFSKLPHNDWLFLLQFLAVFLLIVLVWHANAQHVMVFRLRAGVFDSLIPFSFSLPLFFLIQNCGSPDSLSAWSFSFLWLTIAGVVAYGHLFIGIYMSALSNDEDDEDKAVRLAVGHWYPFLAIFWIAAAGSYAAYCANFESPVWFWWHGLPQSGWAAVGILNLFIVGFWVLHPTAFWRRVLRSPRPIAAKG